MNKITFNKPALSVSQQISKLGGRGLIVNDKPLIENALRNLNYYRLSGYWMYFEDVPSDWRNTFITFLKSNNAKCIEFLNFPKDWEKNNYWN